MATSSHLGGRIGPKIAGLVTTAQADHLNKSAHTRAKIHAAGLNEFYRGVEAERKVHLRPLQELLTGHPDTRPELERALSFMARGSGELSSILTERAIGAGLAQSLGSGLANLLAPVNQTIMYDTPFQIPDAGTAASLGAARIVSSGEAVDVIRRNGLNEGWGRHLLEAALSFPGLAELLDLYRRGLINTAEIEHALRRQGVPDFYVPRLSLLKRQLLSPADLALMELRGILPENIGAEIAAQQGVDREDFDRLVLATGEPPGLEQMLEAYRRGFIDKGRLERAIRQSRVRNEWIDVVERLRFEPMPTSDAVEAVVRNYITPHEGQRIAEQNGLEPSQWETLLLAHGRPPGHMQMIELLNRGLVSEAQVDQAVRESDVKDKYVPILRGLRYKIPGERAIVMLLKDGTITEHRAHELLEKAGYEPDVAGAFLHAGARQRTERHKSVALAQILELLEDHAIDEARARALILALGYPAADIPLLLAITNVKRERKYREQAISAARAGYLAHHIDANEAAAELSALGVPAAQSAYLLRIWAVELRTRRKMLTEAQIIHGYRQGAISATDAQERLERLGYHAEDAAFLVRTAGPIGKGR